MQTKIIILEGPDGAGKSTIAGTLAELTEVQLFQDPGSTEMGRLLREHILLNGEVDATPMELTLLFTATRSATARAIRKAIDNKVPLIVLDRWVTSTRIYQGLAGVSERLIHDLHCQFVDLFSEVPTYEFLIDVPFDLCLERLKSTGKGGDRYEGDLGAMKRRHAAYQSILAQRLDGTKTPLEVCQDIMKAIRE